jgi:flagellar hook assembly protein FlgD
VVSGLSASPAALTPGGSAHTAISFRLAQGADVTVCILNSEGTVVRQLTRPGRAAGQVTVPYYGYNGSGQHLAAGRYPVLVVASNGNGSATAETALTITAP